MEYVTVIVLGFAASIALHLARFARDVATMRRIAAQRGKWKEAGRIDEARDFLKNLQFCIIRSGLDESEIFTIHHQCGATTTLLNDMEEEIRVLTHETQEAAHS